MSGGHLNREKKQERPYLISFIAVKLITLETMQAEFLVRLGS